MPETGRPEPQAPGIRYDAKLVGQLKDDHKMPFAIYEDLQSFTRKAVSSKFRAG